MDFKIREDRRPQGLVQGELYDQQGGERGQQGAGAAGQPQCDQVGQYRGHGEPGDEHRGGLGVAADESQCVWCGPGGGPHCGAESGCPPAGHGKHRTQCFPHRRAKPKPGHGTEGHRIGDHGIGGTEPKGTHPGCWGWASPARRQAEQGTPEAGTRQAAGSTHTRPPRSAAVSGRRAETPAAGPGRTSAGHAPKHGPPSRLFPQTPRRSARRPPRGDRADSVLDEPAVVLRLPVLHRIGGEYAAINSAIDELIPFACGEPPASSSTGRPG